MKPADEKYLYLPPEHHIEHDICWGLVGELEEFLLDNRYLELTAQAINLDESLIENIKDYENGDTFQFLLDKGLKQEHDYVVGMQLIRGLILDSCYFLQEALTCSLKMRLSVAFALFRRPLVYNMTILLRMYTEDDFLEKFIQGKANANAKENSFDPAKMDGDKLKDMLTKHDFLSGFFGKDIFEFVYDESNPDSLVNMTNRALHPATTRNTSNLTGAMNVNFIFSTDEDVHRQWNYIYSRILFVIFFYVTLTDLVVFSRLRPDKKNDKLLNERISRRQNIMFAKFGSIPKTY